MHSIKMISLNYKDCCLSFCCLFLFGQLIPSFAWSADRDGDSIKNTCEYLGGRSDKNFLGSGNVALVIEPGRTKVLFVQQWKEKGLFDWGSGTVRAWYPDRIEMNEVSPPLGATLTQAPTSRTVFITRDDVAGMQLTWKNATSKTLSIRASFTGMLPGNVRAGITADAVTVQSSGRYSDKLSQSIFRALGASLKPVKIELRDSSYAISFLISIKPGEEKSLALLLGTGTDKPSVTNAVNRWARSYRILEDVRQDWNAWFNREIPQFGCSDPYFEKLYYYRWWSLYTKMIFAQVGHFYYPAPREGTVGYDGVVSYSGACISVDELRWMRKPGWSFSTTKEFFAPGNMNDGYLSNHIWDWGIDADESNVDAFGRSVPYQNYAIDAFRGAMLVHPEEGLKLLKQLWPQMCTNLESYPRIFDIDKDGLYETYPWSNSAGQEWTARYFYFDPIPEILRNERSRTYAPDGSRAAEDMELVKKIRSTVVTDPDLHWPDNAEELYRIYYGTLDHRLATVDQTTYAYKNFVAAASLSRALNDTANERRYSAMSEYTRRQLLSSMWDKKDRFFYDLKPIEHKLARVKASTGFYVFWAKIAGQQHLPMLEHLFNPASFWTNYPVPSLPLDYEKYAQLQQAGWTYWNYATWPRTTCHVVDGVLWAAKTLDSSLTHNAARLFDRYTRMHFPNGDFQRPNIGERYDPHTGEAFLEALDYNHSSWIDLVMQHVAGISPQDSDTLLIDPIDMGWKSFFVSNIRYRNHDIDIEFSRQEGLIVRVDGMIKAHTARLQRISLQLQGIAPRK
ncbi:MAG TPA: trehalase family glycosidase [Flavitalea sp.]|nr:trehalase family glycosidase [Flavitalea sp.]